jgi:hypothetical protein
MGGRIPLDTRNWTRDQEATERLSNGPMILKVARPTVPPALLYAPNMIASIEVEIAAARHGLGKNFKRQTPRGISQPNMYQKLRSVTQCHNATKKLTGDLACPAILHGHLNCPITAV